MDVPRPNPPEQAAPEQRSYLPNLHWPHFAAVVLGAGLAVVVSGGGRAVWGAAIGMFSPPQKDSRASAIPADPELDRQTPQRQAEILLERAVSSSDEGTDQSKAQIKARLDAWRGKLKMDNQLGQLTTVALNSSDHSVRASAIEVQLAAYGLTKNQSSVDALVRQADSSDHAQKIWALWALGLLGNRGIETDRVVKVLTAHLKTRATIRTAIIKMKTRAAGPSKASRWWEPLQPSCPCSMPCTTIPRRWCGSAPPAVLRNPAC